MCARACAAPELQLKTVAILACGMGVALAATGVDVSAAVGPSDWQCMAGQGISFGIIRAYQSIGQPDPNCPHTIYNAWDGGMSHVDIYSTCDGLVGAF